MPLERRVLEEVPRPELGGREVRELVDLEHRTVTVLNLIESSNITDVAFKNFLPVHSRSCVTVDFLEPSGKRIEGDL